MSTSNAVLNGFLNSEFKDLEVYSEVLQDAVFELLDAEKVRVASATSITLSEARGKQVFSELDKYKDRLILRPQEISNHPEIIRRLGLIEVKKTWQVE